MYGDGSRPGLSADGRPLPVITPLNQGFWDRAREGVFSIQTCKACGHKHIPESPVCPRCLGPEQDWEPASGHGTLESWAEFHRAYWDGFKTALPYRVCLVRLEEGPLFVGNIDAEPSPLRIGVPVHVRFKSIADGVALPIFELF